MFSVTYTGINFLPLCTAIVCPTISGIMVDRRDQVFTTFFSNRRLSSSIFFTKWSSTKGPFFSDLAKASSLYFLSRRFTINRSVNLLLRVLYPRVG